MLYHTERWVSLTSDFVNLLRQATSDVIETLEPASGISRSNKQDEKAMEKMVYLILDHVDLIREWDKGSMVLQFLFNLYSVLKMPQFGIILISGLPPNVALLAHCFREQYHCFSFGTLLYTKLFDSLTLTILVKSCYSNGGVFS
ncbi:hypothetical protein EUTSA_v10027287mg [Eutrema salsugineum]|uniref:Uncharacterized protein n=1 Tax=Eutrema salsugineum TaxID=72664 RepID=V4MN15_EUTSA|nr:hypothetical protein EUTSA_v10027287mg [Eutrema salsugineum]